MQLDMYYQFQVSIMSKKSFYTNCIFLKFKSLFYFVVLIKWKIKFSNYSTFTLKIYWNFIHSTDHSNLFYYAK
jgi:hypothetical protein